MKDLECDHPGLGWALNPMTVVLIRDRGSDSHRDTERDQRPQKQGLGEPQSHELNNAWATRHWKRQEDSLLEPSEGARPCPHHDFGLLVSKTMRELTSAVLSPPPPSLWWFVPKAPGHHYRGHPEGGHHIRSSEPVFLPPFPRLGGSDL